MGLPFADHLVTIWIIMGLLFVALEFVIPGFVIIFFAFGAWLTAITTFFIDISFPLQMIIFCLSSIASLLLFRKYLRNKMFNPQNSGASTLADEFVGHRCEVIEAIEEKKIGKVSFKGASWSARSEQALPLGEEVIIIKKENLTLFVQSIDS